VIQELIFFYSLGIERVDVIGKARSDWLKLDPRHMPREAVCSGVANEFSAEALTSLPTFPPSNFWGSPPIPFKPYSLHPVFQRRRKSYYTTIDNSSNLSRSSLPSTLWNFHLAIGNHLCLLRLCYMYDSPPVPPELWQTCQHFALRSLYC